MGCPRIAHGAPLGRRRLAYANGSLLSMVFGPFPWVAYGSRAGYPWAKHWLALYSWGMGYLWRVHGLPVGEPWVARGLPVGRPWGAHG